MRDVDIERLRRVFSPGTKIRAFHTTGPYPVKPGTTGIVQCVDEYGRIQVDWSDGSLNLLYPEVDVFKLA